MRQAVAVLSIWLLISTASFAAADTSPSAQPGGISQDAQLQARAEGVVPGRAVEGLLRIAAEATGVHLSADQACADQKVILIVRSPRIGEVLDLVGSHLGNRWVPVRTDHGAKGYRLVIPKERRGLAARLRLAAERDRRVRMTERLEFRLRFINSPPEVLARLQKQDPFIVTAASNAAIRARLQLATLLTPIERRSIVANQPFVSLPLAQLPHEIQTTALRAGGVRSDSVDLSRVRYTIRRESEDGADHLRVRLLSPDGRPMGRSSDLIPTDSPRRGAAIPVVKYATDPSRKSKDPAFQRSVELIDKQDRPIAIQQGLPVLLDGIARASGLDVFSDYYAGQRPRFAVERLGKRPLWQLLNIIAEQYCLNWERRGSILLFRHREWFEMDAEEIPERLLHTWTTSKAPPEKVAPGDFLNTLGQLTTDQLRGMRFQIPGPVIPPPYIWEQWLGSLSPAQRLALVAGQTLTDKDLSHHARSRLLPLLGKPEGIALGGTAIRARIESSGVTITVKAGTVSLQKPWALPTKGPAPKRILLKLTPAR